MEYFNLNAEEKYKGIIHRTRPCTEDSKIRHPRMPAADRAKIFAPFSALKGYETVIQERQKEILLISRPLLSEDAMETLSRKLNQLKKGMQMQITCFQEDEKAAPLGSIQTHAGTIAFIDPIQKFLILDGIRIYFDDILELS